MSKLMHFLAVAVAAASLAAPVLDASLAATDGRTVRVADFRGRPAVLFYEDRAATAVNAHFKRALFRRGRERALLDAVAVVPVANLRAYDFFPARAIALEAVRRIERRVGTPILVDFDGALAAPPWSLPATGAGVVVLAPDGHEAMRRTGRLDAADEAALFARLEELVARGSVR